MLGVSTVRCVLEGKGPLSLERTVGAMFSHIRSMSKTPKQEDSTDCESHCSTG